MNTIIGIGNLERGDDAIGLIIAGQLREELPDVHVVEHSSDGAGLVELLSQSECAYIVDAADFGATPGDVRVFDAALEPTPAELATSSTHGFGLAQALELARALGSLPRACHVFAIQAESFELGEPVSYAVGRAAEAVIEQIRSALAPLPTPASTVSSQPLTVNRNRFYPG